jgi:CheY-like chemotaxis protein
MACRSQVNAAMTTILVVDDEPSIVELVRFTLEDADVRVVEASDGAEALILARRVKPDLVLLDVQMPRLDVSRYAGSSGVSPPSRARPSSCSRPPASRQTEPAASAPARTST